MGHYNYNNSGHGLRLFPAQSISFLLGMEKSRLSHIVSGQRGRLAWLRARMTKKRALMLALLAAASFVVRPCFRNFLHATPELICSYFFFSINSFISAFAEWAQLLYTAWQSSSGVGGQGLANIFVQCVFKSVYSQEQYSKTGKVFRSLQEVLHATPDTDNGYFARDFPTDKESLHNYTRYYDIVLQPYYSVPVTLLEVGVKKGGSLKMWRELFSVDSTIYGVDIDPSAPTFPADARIKTLIFDSRDPYKTKAALRGLEGKIDIIIDDGNHLRTAQMETARALMPFLSPTGVYIWEDVSLNPNHFGYTETCQTFYCSWRRHTDASGYEHVTFLYPKSSKALRTELGLIASSEQPY